MPELPEVETVRRDMETLLGGVAIRDVEVIGVSSVVGPAVTFRKKLAGARFISFGRRGKLLLFGLDLKKGDQATLAVHLRMTGQWIHGAGHAGPLTRVVLQLDDGNRIHFNDQRRFGRLEILDEAGLVRVLSRFGPEPLDDSFTPEVLAPLVKRRRALKALLLDQQTVAGIGNIYADEILFRAGIRPQRLGVSLKAKDVEVLHRAIRNILKKAVQFRGTSFSDYRDGKGEKGDFEKRLKVYGREAEPCRVCGSRIQLTQCAGRSTRYCGKCQKSR